MIIKTKRQIATVILSRTFLLPFLRRKKESGVVRHGNAKGDFLLLSLWNIEGGARSLAHRKSKAFLNSVEAWTCQSELEELESAFHVLR